MRDYLLLIDNIIYMREYINNLDYNNLKTNNKNTLFLKYKVFKNNRDFFKELENIEYVNNGIKLDTDQKKCVFSNEINTLVLAGAGSGKTFTIVSKIEYLINVLKVNPNEILCLSFTNEAVNNLKNKLKYEIDIFTFHKLAINILSDYNYWYSNVGSDYLKFMINEIFYSICGNIDEKLLNSISSEINNFINLFNTYNYSYSYLKKIIKKNKNKMLLVIEKIYLLYKEELYSTNSLDFNDMIIKAIDMIKNSGLRRFYKYIIIDEFQDISNSEYFLIKEIQESCNSFVFCVGDDFQSIYKFAGSKLELITNFKKYFKHPLIIRINNTYRNSNELIDIASKFIMKNKYQIKKRLKSDITLYKPIKIIYYKKNMSLLFEKLLKNNDKEFLILSRNSFDINQLINNNISYENGLIFFENKSYRFLTVHKSKGLEAENIILLNLSNNMYGFPSKKHSKLEELLYDKDKYLYEEERRLFYVALTRTRNYVYLFVDKDNPSIFIKEIININKKDIEVLYL